MTNERAERKERFCPCVNRRSRWSISTAAALSVGLPEPLSWHVSVHRPPNMMYLQESGAAEDQKFGTENMTYPQPAFNPPPTDEGVQLPPSDLYWVGVRVAFSSSLP